jgi:hypothetical protein
MAGHVVDALTALGICIRSLQHAITSDPKVRAEIDHLIDGLNRFQTALTQIAADAATGLARYELDHADGLADIRESFERFRALGVLRL